MPISVTSWPSAPALLMPYIGLCGLLPVSLSERAQKTVPLTSRARRRRRAQADAAQDGAVAVEGQAELRVDHRGSVIGVMAGGMPSRP